MKSLYEYFFYLHIRLIRSYCGGIFYVRAGLLSCVLYLLFAMKHPDLYYPAIVQVIITYISFSAYFRGESVIPLSAVALAELFVLLLTIRRADHVFKVQQEEAR